MQVYENGKISPFRDASALMGYERFVSIFESSATHFHVFAFNSSSQLFVTGYVMAFVPLPDGVLFYLSLSAEFSAVILLISVISSHLTYLNYGCCASCVLASVVPAVIILPITGKNTKIWAPSHRLSSQFHHFTFGLLSSFIYQRLLFHLILSIVPYYSSRHRIPVTRKFEYLFFQASGLCKSYSSTIQITARRFAWNEPFFAAEFARICRI